MEKPDFFTLTGGQHWLCQSLDEAEVAVSCDGTWARRGFQSLYGMVSAISVQTGKVVDIEMKSKVCYKCRAKSNLEVNSQSTLIGLQHMGPNAHVPLISHQKPWRPKVL